MRVSKIPPRARKDVPARRVHWYHPACIFKSFERASKKTKTIDGCQDVEGFGDLHPQDQRDLGAKIESWAARKAVSLDNYKPKKKRRASPSAMALALALSREPKRLASELATPEPGQRMVANGSEFVTPPASPSRPRRAAVPLEEGVAPITPSDGPSSDEERSMCSTDSLSAFFPADPMTRELLEDDLLAMPLDSLAHFDANDTLDFGALLPSIFDAEDPTEGV